MEFFYFYFHWDVQILIFIFRVFEINSGLPVSVALHAELDQPLRLLFIVLDKVPFVYDASFWAVINSGEVDHDLADATF